MRSLGWSLTTLVFLAPILCAQQLQPPQQPPARGAAAGQPALVVPPTANLQTNWGWGVASSRISRIDHQFQRNYPGAGMFGGPFRPTPVWPHDTTQFGVYYVRGPW